MIRELLADIEGLRVRLRRGSTVNVNDRHTKDAVMGAATLYFSACRPHLVRALGETPALLHHDAEWQGLIRLAHGNNSRRTFLKSVASLRSGLTELNIAALSSISNRGGQVSGPSSLTPAEALIIRTLENSIPPAAASYRQAILDLNGGDRLSYRGTASELRESLREALDQLAPDADVSAQQGFTLEPGQKQPTMKQKALYILTVRGRSRKQRTLAVKSIELVDMLSGEIARAVYDRASLATHVEASRAEVLKLKRYVDTVFFDLLEIVDATVSA
jgi:hypothetical protein